VFLTLFGLAFFMTRRHWDEIGFDDHCWVEWGPVGTWAGAIATVLVVMTTALVALGYFDGIRGPRLRLTLEATEPWCREGKAEGTARPCGSGSGWRTWAAARRGVVLAG
jgi:hypothetical protein